MKQTELSLVERLRQLAFELWGTSVPAGQRIKAFADELERQLAAPLSAELPVAAWLVDGRVEQGLFFDKAAAEAMAEANCGTVRPLVLGDTATPLTDERILQIWEEIHGNALPTCMMEVWTDQAEFLKFARALLAQRAAPPAQGSGKEGFEAWAKSHGEMSLESAEPYEYRADNGWFPATYRANRTELAWRAWANKPAAAPQAPQQEPVGYFQFDETWEYWTEVADAYKNEEGVIPLYAAPISAKETE